MIFKENFIDLHSFKQKEYQDYIILQSVADVKVQEKKNIEVQEWFKIFTAP